MLDELVAFGSTVHRTVRDAELLNPYQYECVLELWMVVACVLDGASAQRLRQEVGNVSYTCLVCFHICTSIV